MNDGNPKMRRECKNVIFLFDFLSRRTKMGWETDSAPRYRKKTLLRHCGKASATMNSSASKTRRGKKQCDWSRCCLSNCTFCCVSTFKRLLHRNWNSCRAAGAGKSALLIRIIWLLSNIMVLMILCTFFESAFFFSSCSNDKEYRGHLV